MKKSLPSLFFLTTIFGCTIFASSATAKTFPDINYEHPNFNAINYLSTKGIIKGYTDGTFRPDQQITRAELAKMILAGKNFPIKNYQTNCFPDVGYLEWHSNYICAAKEANFIKGYNDGTFKPEQFINKVEALKIIAEIYKWEIEFEETPEGFSDTPYSAWYIDYVLYGIEKDLFQEFDDENINLSEYQFKPGEFITRAEVAEILYRYLVTTELNKDSFYPQNDDSEESSIPQLPKLKDGELKIILSWENPDQKEKTDFDAHLIEPTDEEIYFSHKLDSKLETILEIKENVETINILKIKNDEEEKDKIKTYLYFVNNFSGDKNFAEAKVKVEIYDQNGLAKVFLAYNNSGKIWKLLELNGNYELTIFNSIGGCELIDRNSTVCPFIPEES